MQQLRRPLLSTVCTMMTGVGVLVGHGTPTVRCSTKADAAPAHASVRCSMTAAPGAKRVSFVRHGQGHHNDAHDRGLALGAVQPGDHSIFASEEWADAHLTPLGICQAEGLAESVRQLNPELILCSAQTRTLQTACHFSRCETAMAASVVCFN